MRAYRTGGGRQGQRRPRGSLTVLKSSIPFVVAGREPAGRARRRRRRGHREREGPRPDPAADPRPRGDDGGLRAPRPRGGARSRPYPGGRGRRRRRRGLRAGPRRAGGCTGATARTSGSTSSSPARRRSRRSPTGSKSARVIGTRAIVEPPVYRGVTVVAKLKARPRQNPSRLQEDALKALYAYFDPITGGPEGTGWPFGRPVNVGEVYSVLQGLPRDGARRGRPAVRRRPDHRPARPADPAARARAERARLQLRAPGPGRGRLTMRGTVAGLASPRPMGPALPARPN